MARNLRLGTFTVVAFAALALPASAPARSVYVASGAPDGVIVIDTATNTVVAGPITSGGNTDPDGISITPNGARAYVANDNTGTLAVIDTATNTVVGPPTPIGAGVHTTATHPDGTRAYLTDENAGVYTIDTATNAVGPPIPIGPDPYAVAITPDGARGYVTISGSSNTTFFDTATNTIGQAIFTGVSPQGIAITPDGTRAYVANRAGGTVSVINTATNAIVGTPIPMSSAQAVAITPDGTRVYVGREADGTVSVIDTATNTIVGTPIPVGAGVNGIAITPDGSRAYVASTIANTVSVIDTATNTVSASIPVGAPRGVAILPNQPPAAAFDFASEPAGSPSFFGGSGSSDPDGTVARYDWDFGDGTTLPDGGPTPAHAYAAPGTYTVTLTVTDNEGCSTAFVFTGQTASCNGGSSAVATRQVVIDPPPVLGESVNLRPVAGRVRVDVPGDGTGFIPLEDARLVPMRTKVDTRRGRVELTSARKDPEPGTALLQSAEFYEGLFRVTQGTTSDRTTLKLLGRLHCQAPGRRLPARHRRRHLWGSGSGNFSSSGGSGSASVRGTIWKTFDRCGGITGVRVKEGRVRFRNFYTHRTRLVRAGQTAIARPSNRRP